MVYGNQISLMIFIIITIFLLLSLQCTYVLIVNASLNARGEKEPSIHGFQGLYEKKKFVKVSGDDEKAQEDEIVEKIRSLLGMESFKTRKALHGFLDNDKISPSPSPSPEISPSPSPMPALSINPRSGHLFPHPKPRSQNQEVRNETRHGNWSWKKLLATIVPSVVAFLACVFGLVWFSKKLIKQGKRKTPKSMLVYSRKKGLKYVNSKKNSKKVSFNHNSDMFFIGSGGVDLELQRTCLKPNSAFSSSTNELEKEKLGNSESDNASSSSTREIVSIHEDGDSLKYDDAGGDRSLSQDNIKPIEIHSFDDESFHSAGDLHSPNARLSDASSKSVSETAENLQPNVENLTPIVADSTKLQCSQGNEDQGASSLKDETKSSPPLPPPPPPPPPPRFIALPPRSSSTICARKSKARPSLESISSRNSDCSSEPNPTPPSDMAASPKSHPRHSPNSSLVPPPPCPPPCPPPFSRGNGNSSKGPPPPPSQPPQLDPSGKHGTLPKLKPLHWDKVRATPDRTMVWHKLRSSSFELDEEMIESLFGYNLQNPMKNDEAKSRTPSPTKHVLEPKRLQNITILSKALNATAEQICDALLHGTGLGQQQLEALVKMVPTKEEEIKLNSYEGDINELGAAEKFVKALISIPYASQRIEAMLYRETFEDEVVHLRNSFSMLEEACKELRSSRLFLKLLEAVLKTGNRMNVGTIRGGAKAFKLDALLKLSDIKGTDGKTTLLHFVVQEMIRSEGIRLSDSIMGKIEQKSKNRTAEEKEEDYKRMGLDLVSGLSHELYNAKKTATVDLDVLASSVSNLSHGLDNLQHLVCKEMSLDEESGNKFVHSMRAFLSHAEKSLKELKEDEDRVLVHVREITEYFHGDVSKEEANPLRIFVIVRDFLGMLDHVCRELRCFKVPNSPNPLAPFR